MASFSTYEKLITQKSDSQRRLFAEYSGSVTDFDIIIVGSGIGGGILADDLAEKTGKRILVVEAGSYLFPTHVYNCTRFPNDATAKKYTVKTFEQSTNSSDEFFIGEEPQLNFGGRSIFWSGLIPSIQTWEQEFFPDQVRDGLSGRLVDAGRKMNESKSLGKTADRVVTLLRNGSLAQHFEIKQTPRALHQPYLTDQGTVTDDFFKEPTGVFNTAELLTNQIGLNPNDENRSNSNAFQLLLNHYVETISQTGDAGFQVRANDLITGQQKLFRAGIVVVAAGSIESPKLIRRSPVYNSIPEPGRHLVGRGLTDHPTTDSVQGPVTHIFDAPIRKNSHAKIILYSRGLRDSSGAIIYPFNVEMNINHEYWHLRENDPDSPQQQIGNSDESIMDIKFSFGNFLDDHNEIGHQPFQVPDVPGVRFKNNKYVDYLATDRLSALAGWNKSSNDIWWTLNQVTNQIFEQFGLHGDRSRPGSWYGERNNGFGYGTVHHAAGTLRMPYKTRYDEQTFNQESVVDENLMVRGVRNLFVCDMSVMPYSSAANPVRTLAALALRLSDYIHLLP
jgi:choline dehydrogenase-like flavoprotein